MGTRSPATSSPGGPGHSGAPWERVGEHWPPAVRIGHGNRGDIAYATVLSAHGGGDRFNPGTPPDALSIEGAQASRSGSPVQIRFHFHAATACMNFFLGGGDRFNPGTPPDATSIEGAKRPEAGSGSNPVPLPCRKGMHFNFLGGGDRFNPGTPPEAASIEDAQASRSGAPVQIRLHSHAVRTGMFFWNLGGRPVRSRRLPRCREHRGRTSAKESVRR